MPMDFFKLPPNKQEENKARIECYRMFTLTVCELPVWCLFCLFVVFEV